MNSRKLFAAGLNRDFIEVYYIIDLDTRKSKELICDNTKEKKNLLNMIDSQFEENEIPYELEYKNQFLPYLINPHSCIKVADKMLSFMLQAPYFREINLHTFENRVITFNNEDSTETIISASSIGIVDEEKIFLSVNSSGDRAEVYKGLKKEMDFNFYEYDVINRKFNLCSDKISGLIDNMHQVGFSKKDFIVALDMNISVNLDREQITDLDSREMRLKYKESLFPVGKIFIYDIKTKNILQMTPPLCTPAHVEFDINNPEIFYVSCHNMSKFKTSMILHGPGAIIKYSFDGQQVKELGSYSDLKFNRITSHKLFKNQGKTYIAVTGYPNYLYIIEAELMLLKKKIEFFDVEKPVVYNNGLFTCTGNKNATLYMQVNEEGTEVYLINNNQCFIVNWIKESVESFIYTQNDFTVSAHLEIF